MPDKDAMLVFDRSLLRQRRNRVAARLPAHDFLFREAADRLADRLMDVTRTFPTALDLGSRTGLLGEILAGRGGIETLIQAELSHAMLRQAPGLRVVADAELLPFAPGSFDLVISVLDLHWVNDLPGSLAQVNRALKPDGMFLACMLGGETLTELRQSLLLAESELEGGVSPRLSPLIDLPDAAMLLQRTNFALPVVDVETITVTYDNALRLMHDLRGMGEANAVLARRRTPTRRATMLRAAALYQERFGMADGRIPATFQIVMLTGWHPHQSQQKPLRPGEARTRLAAALETTELSAGEKAKPS